MTIQQSNEQIIDLLAKGKTYKEISAEIGMALRTIEHRIHKMKQQHACLNRDQLLIKLLKPNFGNMAAGG